MGGSSGGGGTQTTKTVAEPSPEVKPYLGPYLSGASQLSKQPYQQYPGQRIAAFDPAQTLGLDLTAQRAIQGNPAMNSANGLATDTLSGKYMDIENNPAWQAQSRSIGDQYNRIVKAGTDSAFAGSGAYGGSAWGEQTAANQEGLGNALSSAYGNLYNTERDYQNRALAFAPSLAQNDYTDLQSLIGVGDAYRGVNQDVLNQQFGDWQEAIQWPYEQSQFFGDALRATMGGAGGTTKSSAPNPNQSSPLAGAAGGALAGASMGPIGMIGGAILGGLLSS